MTNSSVRLTGRLEGGKMVLRPAPDTPRARGKEASAPATRVLLVTQKETEAAEEERRLKAICKERGAEPGSFLERMIRLQFSKIPTPARPAWEGQPAAGSDLDQAQRHFFGGDGKPPGVARSRDEEPAVGMLGAIHAKFYGGRRPPF